METKVETQPMMPEGTMIKCYIHTEAAEENPVPKFEDPKALSERFLGEAKDAIPAMEAAGAAHTIYATKIYNREGVWVESDVYEPGMTMDNETFFKWTDRYTQKHPGCLILAVHAKE
jgi:hypothetical protein